MAIYIGNQKVAGFGGRQGPPGPAGESAYQIALENGFVGTEEEWLASLKGAQGEPGKDGQVGAPGPAGVDGEGVPPGGTTGQMLVKASDTDLDTEWVDPPKGGDSGDYLPLCGGTLTGDLYLSPASGGTAKIIPLTGKDAICSLPSLTNGYVAMGKNTDGSIGVWFSTGTGTVSASNRVRITGAATPTQSADLSPKDYVDTKAPIASPTFTGSISLDRLTSSTVGAKSVAAGNGTTASGNYSQAFGSNTQATNGAAHAEGDSTVASGNYGSHAEGYKTAASNNAAHAEGVSTIASGIYSHAEGSGTTASGSYSHAEGSSTQALSSYSHTSGRGTVSEFVSETVIGDYNTVYNYGVLTYRGNFFVVGMGTSDSARSNCFRVSDTGAFGVGAFNSSGADYAELFEWADGNLGKEDRAGLFVTLDGDKIRVAGPEDEYILGIVSGNPSVVGDVYDDQWAGMFLTDIFGRPLWENMEVLAETDDEGNVIIPAHMERRQKLNPDYDHTIKYTPRTERPEWDAVGLLGKLVAVDDGTCRVNSWATVGEDGKATASAERTKYRVMARLDQTHIRVLIL